ncbi:MAG TPA: hybrid sensor histidine kinase/response regulator [Opitutaceae bacterium]|nr:hybrid sensor histidine kinase/response regulator [Opitutaceae bacterium]
MSNPSTNPIPGAGLKTVLVIDDDRRLRPVLAAALDAHGFRTLTASNAAEGIELARKNLPDIILCDIDMPGMNGRRALQAMRADPELADRQFVLMTGNMAYADPRASMDLGADDFLFKPFSIDDLRSCVAARLKRAALSRHLETRVVEQLRSNLHSTLPHEFFTPLAGVFGLTEMLLEELDDLGKDEIREILTDIHKSSKRLHRTLRNYLFIITLDAPSSAAPRTMEPAQVEEALLAGCTSAIERHLRAKDVTLGIAGARLRSGPSELAALAEELVDNALAFSHQDTPVSVTLLADGKWLRLTIRDEGRGMSPKQLQQLHVFQQHDRNRHEQQGLGLGLVLARRITERMRGELKLESEAGKGTTVHVALPIAG